MRHLLVLAIAAALASCAVHRSAAPVAPPGDSPTFTVATWNVQHWVDDQDNPHMDRDQNEEFIKSETQIAALIDVIQALDADVLALQEVEGTAHVRDFVQEHLSDMGYEHFACAPDDTWHQNVAVMSRLPLGPMTSMGNVATEFIGTDDEPTNFINDRLMAVEVYPAPGHRVLLQVVHLKAGRGDRNQAWRLGQIEFLREWIDTQLMIDPDLNVCILGDFNCTPDSEEMRRLGSAEPGPAYLSVLPEGTPTHPAWEPQRTIDNILANENLRRDHVEGSAEVFTEVGPFDGENRCSDHLPVVATFAARDL